MLVPNHVNNGEHRSEPHHHVALNDAVWWGAQSGFEQKRTHVRGCEWMGAVALLRDTGNATSPDEAMQAAREVSHELERALEGTTDRVFLATLKQLLVAGEITLTGFIIRLSNLYPDEMEALDFQLKERIRTLVGSV